MFAPLAAGKESRAPAAARGAPVPHRCGEPEAVRRGLRPRPATAPRIQPKLTVGAVNDPLEAEADSVAERVLRMDGAAGSGGGSPGAPARPAGAANSVRELLPASGRPLDSGLRSFFEPRFGHDFGQVRIYADQRAAESAQSLGALAYTAGPNIAFGGGRYQPGTGEGRRLLAHELTHVVQQGHAASVGSGAANVAAGRATPSIQRDTPTPAPAPAPAPAQAAPMPQATPTPQTDPAAQVGPLAITKGADPDMGVTVPRADVTQALTDFLYKVQGEQGGQTLHVTDTVKWAVRKMFQGDPIGSASAEVFLRGITPSNPPEFAAAVTKLLPEFTPRARVAHLGTQSPKDAKDTSPKSVGEAAGHVVVESTLKPLLKKLGISKDLSEKILKAADGAGADVLTAVVDQAMSGSQLDGSAKGAIHSAVEAALKQNVSGQAEKQQNGAGSPYAPVAPPSSAPQGGSPYRAPGEHIFNLPKIPWDFPTKPIPKPNLPQAPAASAANAVQKIIDGLDDNSLVPAAAKGTADASNFGGAKELARSFADQLAAADKKKKDFTVTLTISMSYRHVEDLRDIFDKMEAIVRQIAAALPGGAANVGEVIITPATAPDDKTFPARRIVHLHSSE